MASNGGQGAADSLVSGAELYAVYDCDSEAELSPGPEPMAEEEVGAQPMEEGETRMVLAWGIAGRMSYAVADAVPTNISDK